MENVKCSQCPLFPGECSQSFRRDLARLAGVAYSGPCAWRGVQPEPANPTRAVAEEVELPGCEGGKVDQAIDRVYMEWQDAQVYGWRWRHLRADAVTLAEEVVRLRREVRLPREDEVSKWDRQGWENHPGNVRLAAKDARLRQEMEDRAKPKLVSRTAKAAEKIKALIAESVASQAADRRAQGDPDDPEYLRSKEDADEESAHEERRELGRIERDDGWARRLAGELDEAWSDR